MSPTQHQARVYMGNSEPYTYWVESVILYIKSLCAQNKICGIVVKTLQKNYVKWTTLNEVRKTRIITLVLYVVWLRSMGDDTPKCGVSDILCRW